MRTSKLLPPSLALVLGACAALHGEGHHEHPHGSGARAHAVIEGRSNCPLAGEATFEETSAGVLIDVRVHDAPGGWHAVHIHEVGDCSAPDGSSAGGHFNPGGLMHGAPDAHEHHAGDLGNMWVQSDGTGRKVILMPELTVSPGAHSVVGRAIIVHASADDLTTQPTGNAGGRIGCGEIR